MKGSEEGITTVVKRLIGPALKEVAAHKSLPSTSLTPSAVDKMIKNTEKRIYEVVKSSNPEIIDSINNTGKLEEQVEKKLTSIIGEFKKNNK